jgi:ubiquinone/menaquinone biosynthesis C-methylase UbiE
MAARSTASSATPRTAAAAPSTAAAPAGVVAPDLAAIKARQQAAWASGDYAVVGTTVQIVGELLVEAVDPRANHRVADVAAGSGNTALAAARRGCEVVAVDYVPALLERGRRRAAAEGLIVDFREGDAEALPLEDGACDRVLSTFGVMFTADHRRAAGELLRVLRPGGSIGLANWTPESAIGRMFGVISKYVPPPAGLAPASKWGTEGYLAELFRGDPARGARVRAITATRRDYRFRYRSASHWLDVMRSWYGPMVKTFAALDAQRQAALAGELTAFMESESRSGDATLVVPSEYLEVVITTK